MTNALCAVVFAFAYPETRGKSLEEIDEIFGDVKVIRQEDVKFSEKAGLETLEYRGNRTSTQDA